MTRCDGWKKRLSQIEDSLFSLKKTVMTHDLPDDSLTNLKNSFNIVEVEVSTAVQELEYQDESRGLYSLSRSKSANVKYPRFNANDDEDFDKFETDFRDHHPPCFIIKV